VNFNVNDNWALTFDAINLTNEEIFQFSGFENQPRAIYDNGSQYYLGVRMRY
jgi:iron complex outermembrane receptor protein